MAGFEATKAGDWEYLIDDNDLKTYVESRKERRYLRRNGVRDLNLASG